MVTICLNMIVKNESKNIIRLFDSVVSIIDTYCICDTGSTDSTVSIIEQYFKDKNINGILFKEEFKDFSYNRNIVLKKCFGMSDYVLLLDADMILKIFDFNKNNLLSGDVFYILQGSDSYFYKNIRIIKNNNLFKYIGPTHEYIDKPFGCISIDLDKSSIFINDIGDGGCKGNKYERDIMLLTESLKNDEYNTRTYFYLANSYYDIGKYDLAIKTYLKRIELNGWKEEVWYSYYRIGMIYKHMGKWADAIYIWLNGYNFYPNRLEGIYEIIHYYRNEKKYHLAMIFYDIAKNILVNTNEKDLYHYLFVKSDVYKSLIYFEYTIIAAYLGIKKISDETIIILNNSTHDATNRCLLSNLKYYCNSIHQIMQVDLIEKFNSKFNSNTNVKYLYSSMIKKGEYYILNISYFDNLLDNLSNINFNKYVKIDKQFNEIEKYNMKFGNNLKNIKLFNQQYNSNLNILYVSNYKSENKICYDIGKYNLIDKTFDGDDTKQINSINSFNSDNSLQYITFNNNVYLISNWFPLKIYDEFFNLYATKKMPNIYKYIKDSTCGFNYNNEIWFINIIDSNDLEYSYNIISVFDNNMNLIKYSSVFNINKNDKPSSIIVEDDVVLINLINLISLNSVKIGIYDKNYIDSLLKYN